MRVDCYPPETVRPRPTAWPTWEMTPPASQVGHAPTFRDTIPARPASVPSAQASVDTPRWLSVIP